MADKKNALAELAEDLEVIVKDTVSDFYTTRIRKAQRIIAELAKVKDTTDFGVVHVREDMAIGAIENCRAIAEEGVKDGK